MADQTVDLKIILCQRGEHFFVFPLGFYKKDTFRRKVSFQVSFIIPETGMYWKFFDRLTAPPAGGAVLLG